MEWIRSKNSKMVNEFFERIGLPILFFIQLTIWFIIIYVFCPEKTEDIFSVILYIEGNIPIHKKRRTLYGKKRR